MALLLSVLANGIFFFHAHELENGRIITHAHPLLTEEQQELPDHGHTEEELIFLDLIAHADYLIFDLNYELPLISIEIATQDAFLSAGVADFEFHFGFDHRGPPIA
ncbi:hypothetical protein ACFOUP_13925 [Belliella kenyensis]|uniref:Uncharacterized protein n=1 Tax=Belliella kenyensis TaxID=1472724 RepID=A0ABV8EPF9_9BACT|nr:hypothetical protein [Belliella kenyensis]MCH7401541.1 hypothetical protein [Belliella kenyensis]MDN3603179.1 hypothetical protein [Belliella kenyensis]